ncbi:translation initiation factor IF-2 [Desulfobacula toluolica]|uniref:Translation initiation factor IF-2 n=1 Tax=Desulfobacula toluolica (strain DSM 7467 / Tol2) TaxID=651182 RepID=K0N3D4_DESTT|nr:translation initiation factor IF-2 [Desulfobacula toluolica]CCK78629.1 InfB: translation initiation factor IF-2 [Desulfobacula toluolica Tol2]
MAKVRVYELAKDLNMTNRALLNKMKELKIEVKSHMSSLEDSAISAIKRSLLGKDKKNNDVQVKPSVIRRRRQKVEDTVVQEEDEELNQAVDSEKKSSVQEELTTASSDVKQQSIEKAPEELELKKTFEIPDPELKKAKLKPKIKKSQPAKIIKPAVIKPAVIKPAVIEKPEPKVEKIIPEPEPAVPPLAEEKVSRIEVPVVEKDEKPIEAEPETPVKKEVEKTAVKEVEPVVVEDTEKKIKKKKKKKKSTPAKIVKIADPAVLENLRRSASGEDKKRTDMKSDVRKETVNKKPFKNKERVSSPSKAIPDKNTPISGIHASAEMDAIKPKREKRKEAFGEDKPAGKRKQRKKKSVIEGDALYHTGRGRKKRGKKEAKGKKGKFQKTQITTPKAIKRRIKIDEAIELAELAKRMGIKANEMIAKLMTLGVMATVNQTIDFETATLVATEFDFDVEKASFEEEALLNHEIDGDDEDKKIGRAPVVTIMGHVDHGKTSLLDVIRKSKITSGEAGGITQHIGAYNVETPNGGRVTFLDTPGHAAFTAMRSRGAQVTDIVILVVAADDGVMPQTIEAINHSKAAGVPVVVAVNKMDKAGADPDRIMRELSELDLLAEEWGGSVIFVKVSAKTGEGIDDLLEMVLLQSEVLELKANPDRKAMGYVVESRLDTGRGAVATVLVKQGTLSDGDPIVCGLYSGRIRAMIDDSGSRIDAAGPSTPVEIIGLSGVPDAGDEFIAVASDKDAKQIAGNRMQKQRAKELAKKSRANLEKMFENLGSAEVKELKLIVKADVQGSIEALNDSLKDLAKEEVEIKIVHSGAGTINESDVALAAVSDAIIVGFNVRPSPQIRKLAKDEHVDMRFYDIIYNVINDIKAALDGMMPSTFHEIIIGRADVRETFVVPKMGTIAGCHISEGKVIRGKKVRLLRDGIIKCDTQLSSLRRFKDDVKEVEQGYECGIGLEKYNDIKVGDAIECYEVEERKYKAD